MSQWVLKFQKEEQRRKRGCAQLRRGWNGHERSSAGDAGAHGGREGEPGLRDLHRLHRHGPGDPPGGGGGPPRRHRRARRGSSSDASKLTESFELDSRLYLGCINAKIGVDTPEIWPFIYSIHSPLSIFRDKKG